MKKITLTLLYIMLALALAGCGGTTSEPEQPDAPADLTGEWEQVNSNSEDSYQTATISGNTIEIYWVSNAGDTKSLYWAGTYVAPTTAEEPYSWDSENDKEKTGVSITASGDDTKTMTYSDGQLSYQASALGTTTTVKLEKQ